MTAATANREDGARPIAARHVVIVGGGISGLSAAWQLQQTQGHDRRVRWTVLESSDRWGGKVLSERVDGFDGDPFVVEAGPDSFLTQKPWALQLAQQLGLADRLLGTNEHMRNVYVLHRGKPVVLPDGVQLLVPTTFLPFARSPLISPLGKLRVGLELFIPAKRDDRDETLATFVRRRLGEAALQAMAEPLMAGIYNADPEQQSMLATFPRFRQLEREHGSLIRGMRAERRRPRSTPAQGSQPATPSAFMSLQGGTQELVDTLVQHLTGDIRLHARVSAIEMTAANRIRVTTGAQTLYADAVLLATPANVAADLVRPWARATAEKLASIRYVSTGTISLAFQAVDITRPLPGFGLVVPMTEHRPINALTISSTKFSHRAPQGYVLVRVFFGGSRSPQTMACEDEELLGLVRMQLRDILGLEAPPLFHRIYRWDMANPQYDVGHLELVEAIEADLPPRILVTGSAYRGVGMPDCINQAQQAVIRLLSQLEQRPFAGKAAIE